MSILPVEAYALVRVRSPPSVIARRRPHSKQTTYRAYSGLSVISTARLVTRGWADPQNHRSKWRTSRIKPFAEYEIEFELQPHDYEFQAGSHRLGRHVD
jgi:hypothetical protein